MNTMIDYSKPMLCTIELSKSGRNVRILNEQGEAVDKFKIEHCQMKYAKGR